jgi:hypothetical protein
VHASAFVKTGKLNVPLTQGFGHTKPLPALKQDPDEKKLGLGEIFAEGTGATRDVRGLVEPTGDATPTIKNTRTNDKSNARRCFLDRSKVVPYCLAQNWLSVIHVLSDCNQIQKRSTS